jgi:glycosyltransferase involved in cell wall biosynthesis
MREFVPHVSKYPPKGAWLRPAWLGAAIADRVMPVAATYRYDITFLQRELISTLGSLEPLAKRPRVLDVDDAIHLHRGGKAAERIARRSNLIVAGNEFLAEHFSAWNTNIRIVPTAVDTELFRPGAYPSQGRRAVVGWIGTSGNLKHLYEVEDALIAVLSQCEDFSLRVVSDAPPRFKHLPRDRVEYIPWSRSVEVESIQSMSVGIMPLVDSPWTRGKCSFKMLQYMACGVPVVVSPVGMNAEVLALGRVGLGARDDREWVEGLLTILTDVELGMQMGAEGRQVVCRHFSVGVIAQMLAEAFRTLGA